MLRKLGIVAFVMMIGGCGTGLQATSLDGNWNMSALSQFDCVTISGGIVSGLDCAGPFARITDSKLTSVTGNTVVWDFQLTHHAITLNVTLQPDGTLQGTETTALTPDTSETNRITMVRQ